MGCSLHLSSEHAVPVLVPIFSETLSIASRAAFVNGAIVVLPFLVRFANVMVFRSRSTCQCSNAKPHPFLLRFRISQRISDEKEG
jgi:hypothetical protein